MTIKLDAEDIGSLATEGRFWFLRNNGTVYASEDFNPAEGDVYLLNASEGWLEQWLGDWSAAAEYLRPLIERYNEGS